MPLQQTDYFRVMQDRDFLRQHQYRIDGINFEGYSLNSDDLVYMRTAEIPNRTVNQVNVPFMGLNYNVPGTVQYQGTMQVTFYSDQPQRIRALFEAMSYAAFDERYSGGAYTVSQQNVLSFYTYDNRGPDESRTTGYELIGIYPTVVGNMAMDTTTNGSTQNFTATIAYQFWTKLYGILGPTPVVAPSRIPVAFAGE